VSEETGQKAMDIIEPLLKIPLFLSPGWLKIDPNFDPLRGNLRFQKLVARAKSRPCSRRAEIVRRFRRGIRGEFTESSSKTQTTNGYNWRQQAT
jgi:hypothetical protein